jgi:hypothetical protein
MNWKQFQRKHSRPNEGTNPLSVSRDQAKSHTHKSKILVRIGGAPAEIRTTYPPNARLEWHHHRVNIFCFISIICVKATCEL